MATRLTTITNVSKQTVPILLNAISTTVASDSSDIAPSRAESLQIPPGAQLQIETQRIDLGQLERLRQKNLITFVGY